MELACFFGKKELEKHQLESKMYQAKYYFVAFGAKTVKSLA